MVLITIWDNNSGGPIAANPGWYEQWFDGPITEGLIDQSNCSSGRQLVLSPSFPCPGSGIVVEVDPIDFGNLPPGDLPSDPGNGYPTNPLDPPGGTPPGGGGYSGVPEPGTVLLLAITLIIMAARQCFR